MRRSPFALPAATVYRDWHAPHSVRWCSRAPFNKPIGTTVVPVAGNSRRRVNVSWSANAGRSIAGGKNIIVGTRALATRLHTVISNLEGGEPYVPSSLR